LGLPTLQGFRAVFARAAVLRRSVLTIGLFFRLFPMMFDDATGGRTQDGMMTGHMTHHTADGGAFQATLGTSHRRHDSYAGGNDKAGSDMSHIHSSLTTV